MARQFGMGLALSQQMKQTQRLIMTPQMQQSIQLLQMNALELETLAQQEMLENPFLEQNEEEADPGSGVEEAEAAADTPAESVDSDLDAPTGTEPDDPTTDTPDRSDDGPSVEGLAEAAAADGAAGTAPSDTSQDDAPPDPEATPDEKFDEVDADWDNYFDNEPTYVSRAGTREIPEEQTDFTEYTASKLGLRDRLEWQLETADVDDHLHLIGQYIINNINEDGYLTIFSPDNGSPSILTQDPDEVVRSLAEDLGVEEDEVLAALRVIQSFDPVGVGARNLAECLILQLKEAGERDPLPYRMLEEQFDRFTRRRFGEIGKALGATEKQVSAAFERIRMLEPRPGRIYSTETPHYVRPDVYVKEVDGEYIYYLNEGDVGRLRINDYYRGLMRRHSANMTDKEREYTMDKYRSALWLIKNIEKRKSTILNVTEAIMEYQRDFLDKGVSHLRPLTLKVIADQVGMHESTIARVTNSKYVETPRGVFSLKYFFSSSLETDSGEAASSRSIKARITDIIAEEDPKKPLSDQKISDMLAGEGAKIARRTVAKYREQLKILPAKMRKAVKT